MIEYNVIDEYINTIPKLYCLEDNVITQTNQISGSLLKQITITLFVTLIGDFASFVHLQFHHLYN